MSEVKLSFVLPVYQKEHILEKCIKALGEQSLKSWEAIFVLDGPSQEARNIINRTMKKYDNHFKVVEIAHAGASAARNIGFKYTKGENVVFFDCDCLIEPHTAKAWVDIFDNQPEIGFVYSGYRFINERGAINSEPFDPWLLRVRNYVSSCFPVRRKFVARWNESLKSLQDWDFWLSVVENGAIGKQLIGYGFATEFPTLESISGKGCTDEVWLERVDAVKKLHNLPENDVCVSSLSYKQDGIALAKLIGADYQSYPHSKPHKYKTIIQVGFSFKPSMVEEHCRMFSAKTKNIIFWMPDNINEIWNEINFTAIKKYSILLNGCAQQFVEDKKAKDLMEQAGFNVSIMPMPMKNDNKIKDYPENPSWAVDIDPRYGKIFSLLDTSLPDIKLDVLTGAHDINDYTGIVHFWGDKTLSNGLKRMLLTGRQVISNVQSPFCGYINDDQEPEQFINDFIETIRKKSKEKMNKEQLNYYKDSLTAKRLLEVLA